MPSKAGAFAKKKIAVETVPSVKAGLKEGRSRRTLVLDDAQVKDLGALAWLRGRSLSEEVRAAMTAYLETHSKEVARARKMREDAGR